jgi:hypothetical protein
MRAAWRCKTPAPGVRALSKPKASLLEAKPKKDPRASSAKAKAMAKLKIKKIVLTSHDRDGEKCLCETLGLDPWPPSIEG